MLNISRIIDQLNSFLGKTVSWFSVFLVLLIVVDVTLRYLLDITAVWTFEMEWHLFATLFLLSAAWGLKEGKHVRVDVFYNRFTNRQKAIVNLLGSLFLLLPFCWIGFSESLSFVHSSFELRETSPDPGGLPARYLIKSTIPIGFFTLGMQGVSEVLKAFNLMLNKQAE